jgi:hypothetical protein
MRRFLRTPGGWISLLVVEVAMLVALARGLIRAFPHSSTVVYRVVLGFAVVLVIGNYVVRRRYLR